MSVAKWTGMTSWKAIRYAVFPFGAIAMGPTGLSGRAIWATAALVAVEMTLSEPFVVPSS
jgi:hypothetical protein